MNEEILRSLVELFGIITKQDGFISTSERDFVIRFFEQQVDTSRLERFLALFDGITGYDPDAAEEDDDVIAATQKTSKASVHDTVAVLNICKKVNANLTQKQKLYLVMKILELVSLDKNYTKGRMGFIDTVAMVFNIPKEEYDLIESFVFSSNTSKAHYNSLMLVTDGDPIPGLPIKSMKFDIRGVIIIIHLKREDMYFMKLVGNDELLFNGSPLEHGTIHTLSPGSSIRTVDNKGFYYSDVVLNFKEQFKTSPLSYSAENLEYRFADGSIGLRDINISENGGQLVGIMGASGSGKTTLLNVLSGIIEPYHGRITINGLDLQYERDKLHGVIGYISQDDLLIEDLTVYQNIYYNAKLCLDDLTEEELNKKITELLKNLGLDAVSDLKVGSIHNKMISGGQRKRLNIALELIREPSVLFVDEPTSGLSSRDSENVIDLLKELSMKGTLIFVVIHQPSSDIYKLFDKMIILDTGGYQIYYGNPVYALTYFKSEVHQTNIKEICETCGNINPEHIFNIVEDKIVNEYGQFTERRKIKPTEWAERYHKNIQQVVAEQVKALPKIPLKVPSWVKQTQIFLTRDFLSKVSDRQYMTINLLEAPVLALILALIIKYRNTAEGTVYSFRYNENIPAFLLMSVVVALFVGLTVSAEEIIADRKILKRESFLNLSRSSYLISKMLLLFSLSAIQMFLFVFIGNTILGIKGMYFEYWLVLFSASCLANVIGLNISSAFKSAIAVYIVIPIILIPQMILSGVLFSFDKLNEAISTDERVPLVADVMASRWAIEALAVKQFKDNRFEKPIYPFEKTIANANYRSTFWVIEIRNRINFIVQNWGTDDPDINGKLQHNEMIVYNELLLEPLISESAAGPLLGKIPEGTITKDDFEAIKEALKDVTSYYQDIYNRAVRGYDDMVYKLEKQLPDSVTLNDIKNDYYNESLSEMVRNVNSKVRITEAEDHLIQKVDPIFTDPHSIGGYLNYRTHFYAPRKTIAGTTIDTFTFNVLALWIMTVFYYLTLYFNVPHFLVSSVTDIRLPNIFKPITRGGNKKQS